MGGTNSKRKTAVAETSDRPPRNGNKNPGQSTKKADISKQGKKAKKGKKGKAGKKGKGGEKGPKNRRKKLVGVGDSSDDGLRQSLSDDEQSRPNKLRSASSAGRKRLTGTTAFEMTP